MSKDNANKSLKIWVLVLIKSALIYAIITGIVALALFLFHYPNDTIVNDVPNITTPENLFNLKLKEYELHINLYQFYLTLGLSAVSFFYLITGGILAYILKNYKQSGQTCLSFKEIPPLKMALLLPVLLSSVFGCIFIYGAMRWHIIRASVSILRDELGIKRVPDLQILLQMLYLFGGTFMLSVLPC